MVLANPTLLLLLSGAQQPVRAEAVAVLPAHLAGVLRGNRVQTWRGPLTARPAPLRRLRSQRAPPREGSAAGGPAQGSARPTVRTLGGGRSPTLVQLRDWWAVSLQEVPPLAGRGLPGVPALASAAAQHFLHNLGRGTQLPKTSVPAEHGDRAAALVPKADPALPFSAINLASFCSCSVSEYARARGVSACPSHRAGSRPPGS